MILGVGMIVLTPICHRLKVGPRGRLLKLYTKGEKNLAR